MIELLVKYITDKGYEVRIMPRVLLIRKQVQGTLFGIDWAIPKYELHPDMEEVLYWEATKRMDMIDRTIAERFASPIGGNT